MGKDTGFQEWSRQLPIARDVQERITDAKEIYKPFAKDEVKRQAGRCMDCGVPVCHQGCPLGNLIPDWNDDVFRGRWQEAYRQLDSTNNFPEFTGRLCPAPCEAACVLSINQAPVTIEQMEQEIIENAFSEGWVTAQAPTSRSGKRVAVVGSGPAGLAAACQLNRAGHEVTVYEASEEIGGLLRLGIPDFKMEKWVIDRRLAIMKKEGICFEANTRVGETLPWKALSESFDATLLAVGAGQARDLQVEGRELQGIHWAMDFLSQQNRRIAGKVTSDLSSDPLSAQGKRVVVLGGGDTGSDCVGTCHRQGALEVMQIELMPAPPKERDVANPWPQWPMTFRESSSHREGGQRSFAQMTKACLGERGQLHALQMVGVELRDGKIAEVAGSTREIPCDMLLLAIGFTGPTVLQGADAPAIERTHRSTFAVDERYRTNVPGFYSAGDGSRGASLIVWAISEGREAARCIDEDLRGVPSGLPSRGRDLPFGGR